MRLCGTRSTVAAHGGASPPRSVSSHLNNFFELEGNSLLSEDPEGNMVRSLHFTHLSWIYQKSLEVSRGARETRLRPDAHDDAPRPPCRTRGCTSDGAEDHRRGPLDNDLLSFAEVLSLIERRGGARSSASSSMHRRAAVIRLVVVGTGLAGPQAVRRGRELVLSSVEGWLGSGAVMLEAYDGAVGGVA